MAERKQYNFEKFNDIRESSSGVGNLNYPVFSRQASQTSASSLVSGSENHHTTRSSSRCESTDESYFDSESSNSIGFGAKFMLKEFMQLNDQRTLKQLPSDIQRGSEQSMKNSTNKPKKRDLIVQDEEEDDFPFSKYTFNKKTNQLNDKRVHSSMSSRSTSQDSIYSVGLMNQFRHLNKGKILQNKFSSSSLTSLNSSYTDQNTMSSSVDDCKTNDSFDMRNRLSFSSFPPAVNPGGYINPYDMNPGYACHPMYSYPHPPQPPPVAPQTPAPRIPSEDVLNKIGFNEAASILPERFLKSWCEKVLMNQQEEYLRSFLPSMPGPVMPPALPPHFYNPYYVDDSDLPPSVSAQPSGTSTPACRLSLENIHSAISAQKLQQVLARKPLNRSSSFVSSGNNSLNNSFDFRQFDKTVQNNDLDVRDLSRIGALPLQKENSFDKLKRILQSTDNKPVHKDRSSRRSIFAANHQNSLPIFLETLSEEDEEKRRSRTPSIEKKHFLNSVSKMRTFLEDEERLSSAANSGNVSDTDSRSTVSLDMPVFSRKTQSSAEGNVSPETSSLTKVKTSPPVPMNIPSIVVSNKFFDSDSSALNTNGADEKETTCGYNKDKGMTDDFTCLQDVSSAHRPVSPVCRSRPVSPRPASPAMGKSETMHSKDSLEIEEIMSPKDKDSKPGFSVVLTKIDSVSSVSPGNTPDPPSKQKHKHQHLCISPSGFEDKHLSPTSSLASPSVMSPITVIEAGGLDNQGEDVDDSKDGDTSSSFQFIKSHQEKGGHIPRSRSRSPRRKKGHKVNEVPKCLHLKRHSDEQEKMNTGKNELKKESVTNMFVQTDTQDDELLPLMKFSEISCLLERLFHKMPDLFSGKFPHYGTHEVDSNQSARSFVFSNKSDVKETSPMTANNGCRDIAVQCSSNLVSEESNTEESNMKEMCCQTDICDIQSHFSLFQSFENYLRQQGYLQYRPIQYCCCHNTEKTCVSRTYVSETEHWVSRRLYKSELLVHLKGDKKTAHSESRSESPKIDADARGNDRPAFNNFDTEQCEKSQTRSVNVGTEFLVVNRFDYENEDQNDIHMLQQCRKVKNRFTFSQSWSQSCENVPVGPGNVSNPESPLSGHSSSVDRESPKTTHKTHVNRFSVQMLECAEVNFAPGYGEKDIWKRNKGSSVSHRLIVPKSDSGFNDSKSESDICERNDLNNIPELIDDTRDTENTEPKKIVSKMRKFIDKSIDLEDLIEQKQGKASEICRMHSCDQEEPMNVQGMGSDRPIRNDSDEGMTNTDMLQALSSRSLDFETVTSRKGILQRCQKATFSKSIDVGSVDPKSVRLTRNTNEQRTGEVVAADFDHIFGLKDVASERLGSSQSAELFDDKEESQVMKEIATGLTDSAQYQLGCKYNEEFDCYDLFGRVCTDKHIPENEPEHQNEETTVEKITKQVEKQFDMFMQVDDCSDVKDPMFDNQLDARTRKTLQEIERLYSLSTGEELTYFSEMIYTDSHNENLSSLPSSFRSREHGDDYFNDIDNEIEMLNTYMERYQFEETHVCRNCGHHVTVPATHTSREPVFHDYCQECSPLNLTAEMLEQRRLAKMASPTKK